jgi:hypothetical protein
MKSKPISKDYVKNHSGPKPDIRKLTKTKKTGRK